MRDEIIINTTITKNGNSLCMPITKSEAALIGVTYGDDLEVHVYVKERKGGRKED
jgi:antitoxin component of MazEF toxin-antitoxin module